MLVWLGSAFIVLGLVLLLVARGREWYGRWKQNGQDKAAQDKSPPDFLSIATLFSKPDIREPLYFHYLNAQRVEELHSQIEPEWVVRQRKIGESQAAGAKGEIRGGLASAEATGTMQKSQESSIERIQFSAERKCLELMRFAIERNARMYTNGWNWFVLRLGRITMEEAVRAQEQKDQTNRRLDLWDKELESELTQLRGLVFIKGEFVVTEQSEDGVTLVHEFIGDSGSVGDASKKFRPVRFKITVGPTPEIKKLVSKHKLQVDLFGYALHPLGKDGVIEVQAIAVFN